MGSSSSSSRSRRLASNSNQGSPNTQTLPTLTLFLPLQVHGSWLGFLQSSHWKSDSASFGLKVVLSNPSNKGNYERVEIETNEINTFSGSGENKSKEEESSASVGMEIVLPMHSNKENYERDKTNESNT